MAGYFADCIKSFCIVYLTRMVWVRIPGHVNNDSGRM
jgi:hypothetical protein